MHDAVEVDILAVESDVVVIDACDDDLHADDDLVISQGEFKGALIADIALPALGPFQQGPFQGYIDQVALPLCGRIDESGFGVEGDAAVMPFFMGIVAHKYSSRLKPFG